MTAAQAADIGMSSPMSMTATDVLPAATDHAPVGDGGGLPLHGLLVCLAILIAALFSVLAIGRTSKIGQLRRLLEDGTALVSGTRQQWRAAVPDLALLCVSRT